ncbi:MAG: cysteine hydrolase [Chloroflexi bacterium]|nr:cysteine hydrolase [Chloroflexota bacterium]
MQNEFCKPGGKLFLSGRDRTVPPVISTICDLVGRARSADIPIIYMQSVRTLEEPEFTIFGRPPYLKLGTWGAEIIEELKPHKEDKIVQKFTHDAFYKTELDDLLRRLVPDSTKHYAVVTGGGVTTCIRHAVMGLHLRDYWTVVPVDCVVYTRESDRERAFEHFSQMGYPNVFLSRSDIIEVSALSEVAERRPTPGT